MNPCNFPYRKEEKRTEAKARADAYTAMSRAEKIARLDARLGKGVGAKRERACLAKGDGA